MTTHGRPSLAEAHRRARCHGSRQGGGLREVRTAVGKMRNQDAQSVGLDPGVYSGSFPL